MRFAVLFRDNPEKADARQRNMVRHLDFLEGNADAILAAGPLSAEDGTGAGGLWLVEAPDPETVRDLVQADPFWPTGLRRSVEILIWSRVFEDGARRI